eukprot:1160634-Pelagomonas_calceolata.AAC.4
MNIQITALRGPARAPVESLPVLMLLTTRGHGKSQDLCRSEEHNADKYSFHAWTRRLLTLTKNNKAPTAASERPGRVQGSTYVRLKATKHHLYGSYRKHFGKLTDGGKAAVFLHTHQCPQP